MKKITALIVILVVILTSMNVYASSTNLYVTVPRKNMIYSQELTLGENIDLIVSAQTQGDATPYMIFKINGDSDKVIGEKINDGGMWKFTFGIDSQQMSDTVSMELYVDDKTVSTASTSVMDYCDTVYNMTASDLQISSAKKEILNRLIADLLQYGTQSQIYRGYNTGSLANQKSWVATSRSKNTTLPASDYQVVQKPVSKDDYIKSASISLSNTFNYVFKIVLKNATALDVTINGETQTYELDPPLFDNVRTLATDGISAPNITDKCFVTLRDGEQVLHSFYYSYGTYVANMYSKSNSALQNLMIRLRNYSNSAQEYALCE